MFFAINADNTIVAYETQEQVDAAAQTSGPAPAEVFQTSSELTALVKDWPMAKFEQIWNGIAGQGVFANLKPVRKFENRQVATVRLRAAFQLLNGHSGETVGGHEPAELPPAESASKVDAFFRCSATWPSTPVSGNSASKPTSRPSTP